MTSNNSDKPLVVGVRVPNWLGDICMATPALAHIRASLGENGRLIAFAREPMATLCRRCDLADAVITVDRSGRPVSPESEPGISPQLDAMVLMTNTLRPAWQAFRGGIPIRVGAARRLIVRPLLTRAVPLIKDYSTGQKQSPDLPKDWHGPTIVEGYLRLARAAVRELALATTQDHHPPQTRLAPDDKARADAQSWLHDHGLDGDGPRIGFQAAAAYGTAKRYPPSQLGLALREILDTFPGSKAVGLGSPGELPDLQEVHTAATQDRPDLASRIVLPHRGLDLTGFVALLSNLQLVIANDSGPMHMAVAVGTPCVAIFGATDRLLAGYCEGPAYRLVWEPQVECAPCMKRHCPIDHRCMTRIQPNRVASAALDLLGRRVLNRDESARAKGF